MDINTTKEVTLNSVSSFYNNIQSYIPEKYQIFLNLGLFIILIAIYSVFIWKFYRFLAKRDIFVLNLDKYNNSTHPFFSKFFESISYLIKYLIVFPIVIFFWFAVLSVFLIVLSKNQSVNQVILISAGIVGAIRLTAYFTEDLSKDLAKMIPFTLLGIFIIDPSFFSIEDLIQRFSQIPSIVQVIFLYLIFIFTFEIITRLIFTLIMAIKGKDIEKKE